MIHSRRIRVHHPSAEDDIVLRTSRDWEADVLADARDARGVRSFSVRSEEPFLYCKPIVRTGGDPTWAQGENVLVTLTEARALDIYPHFGADAVCSVCSLVEVPSTVAGHAYNVRVFLPPGYAENTLKRYPVLYMHDGQNVFFPEEAFGGHDWKLEETLGVLTSMSMIEEMIVVGIYPTDRMSEYTHPGYDAYGRFIVEELKPFVDATYRTLPDPAHTAMMGSSLGGVVSLCIGWRWPHVIGKVACLSSTFGYRDDLFDRVRTSARPPLHVYLDSGWPRDNYEVTRSMRDTLHARGFADGRDLLYFAFPHAQHNEQSWAMRAHIPVQFFFGPSHTDAPPRRRTAAVKRSPPAVSRRR